MERRIKWMETNEDVNSYWITLGKREDTGTSENKHCIVLRGEIALERLWTCRKTDKVTNTYSVLYESQFCNWPLLFWFSMLEHKN